MELLKNFEPKTFGKEQYHIFNSFTAYTADQVQILLGRIKKIHYHEKVQSEDYQLLRSNENYIRTLKTKDSRFSVSKLLQRSRFDFTLTKSQEGSIFMPQKQTASFNKLMRRPFAEKSNNIKLPQCNNSSYLSSIISSPIGQTDSRTVSCLGGRFSNIIIIVPFN